jgi:hypothetical protein
MSDGSAPKIPKREQLAALLGGKTWDLAVRYCNSDHQALLRSLDVTLPELVAWAKEHGIPVGWFRDAPATFDGVYLVSRGERWAVYRQERGEVFDAVELDDRDAALELLLTRYYMPK